MAQTAVDIVVKVVGDQKIKKLDSALRGLDKTAGTAGAALPKVGAGAAKAGAGAKAGAVGVKSFGVALKTALGPVSAALTAIAGLGAAFNTLKEVDFASAKVRTLGVDSEELAARLRTVSNELQGQRSVVELTAAAYDVASAGFASAAESAAVLKAASQGATGGFSDLNTVANATTSVLNAYGLSASKAQALVDGFIQTQNDGKIVVAEYAANIGKVASAAAGLSVPIEEVNAAIAQSTAAGVQAEVAFTGLKGALARLASGEAQKALKGTGIEIDAASLKADGLLGTLKKFQGLDTGQIFKALGTEAGPALLPVIQNLEKYEQLIENQKNSAGAAATAQAEAANTIAGAWQRVTVAVQNLFADQSALGELIKGTLMAAAATVEALAAAFNVLMSISRGVAEGIGQLVQSFTGIENGSVVLQQFTDKWFQLLEGVRLVAATIQGSGCESSQCNRPGSCESRKFLWRTYQQHC